MASQADFKAGISCSNVSHTARTSIGTIGMNVKIPRFLDHTPGNIGVLLLYCIGEQCDQLANLYHAHVAGILKKMIIKGSQRHEFRYSDTSSLLIMSRNTWSDASLVTRSTGSFNASSTASRNPLS